MMTQHPPIDTLAPPQDLYRQKTGKVLDQALTLLRAGCACSVGFLLFTIAPGLAQSPVSSAPATGAVSSAASQVSPASPPTDVVPVELESYRLGAGDRIQLEVFNVPEYTGERQVLVDGTVQLPLAGNVSVRGMTLNQAAEAIEVAYGRLLRNPVITLNLIAPRPLTVGVSGEVNRPGSYALSVTGTGAEGIPRWPTLTQAIQTAGGITQLADVRQIQVVRSQHSGEPKTINVNLWALLSGDLQQDLTLRDGDTITIAKASQISPAEATQLATATFSPTAIRVNVVGEVVRPGAVEVPPNTPLNQALLAAGGFDQRRADTGSVELVRLHPDGTVSRRQIDVNLTQGISEQTNPILSNNDVLIVGRSGTATLSDALSDVLDIVGTVLPIFRLF